MDLLMGFLHYFVQAIAYLAIAFGGIMLGKKLREKKDAKKARESGEE